MFSKKLSNTERNYIDTKGELLNIIEALDHSWSLINRKRIIIKTKHINLLSFLKTQLSRS